MHGFAAETSAAVIIQTASIYGIPLSTTHVISTSIMGVGAAKRFSGVKWTVVERIIWAWILTLPATGVIGFILARAAVAFNDRERRLLRQRRNSSCGEQVALFGDRRPEDAVP